MRALATSYMLAVRGSSRLIELRGNVVFRDCTASRGAAAGRHVRIRFVAESAREGRFLILLGGLIKGRTEGRPRREKVTDRTGE